MHTLYEYPAPQALPFFSISAQRQDGSGFEEPVSSYRDEAPYRDEKSAGPRLIRSVVDEVGLSRFVYLRGASGKRYVFSSISKDHLSSYPCAVFAATSARGDVCIFQNTDDIGGTKSKALYVHLLREGSGDRAEIVHDLQGAVVR